MKTNRLLQSLLSLNVNAKTAATKLFNRGLSNGFNYISGVNTV